MGTSLYTSRPLEARTLLMPDLLQAPQIHPILYCLFAKNRCNSAVTTYISVLTLRFENRSEVFGTEGDFGDYST